MYKETIGYKEKTGGFTDGKPNWSEVVEIPSIELAYNQSMRDTFGNIDAMSVFQVLTNTRLKIGGKIIYMGDEFDIKAVQVLKNPTDLSIIANRLLI